MKVHDGSTSFEQPRLAVVTSGTFDGVHIGHRKILKRLVEIARQRSGETVVVTFWPHPRMVLHPEDDTLKLLSTFEEKVKIFEQVGIDHVVRIPFTRAFSQLSSEAFIRNILVKKIDTQYLIIGYDHRFGKNREGSFDYLKENADKYGFQVEEIPRQDVDHVGVSSTKIRNALEGGDIFTANEYLGQPYQITGKVVKGDQLGRSWGFPTANLVVPERYKLIPEDGIYACRVRWEGKQFEGMMYIGVRPTINGVQRNIEVNIFDFDTQIYGETLQVEFIGQIRADMKYENIELLKAQLAVDREDALKILAEFK
ncbi:riboflavin kinase/FMN adenylyltransferase [Catalinimonas alkaloidigena]|uniref:bifunctional riboflavin kinase/FAD synthetase n=1 Tax=Catalinimonas alkaloidigena TaxID=1075417 RepID=UPI002405C78B|nr:bifunctional riboflavin kinase/FAD synthetase [Catalinimonas alkaloidigena]MDF9798442.1 riboflavin kinase/FMN adenylyltransferase [Catalinimonas alkaloidigena]